MACASRARQDRSGSFASGRGRAVEHDACAGRHRGPRDHDRSQGSREHLHGHGQLMAAMFVASVRSEWLKTRRSLTTWVVVGAASFVPAIVLMIRLTRPAGLPALYRSPDFWTRLWISMWESMALMVLPLTIIVLVSLVTQIEYRNNTWKQLHASPQPLGRIFFAKLLVIFALVVELFVCFNVAVYLLAMLPAWLRS